MLSAELVSSVLESAPDAMIIIEASGNILFANRQVSSLFGYEAEEILGQPVELLLPERFRSRHVAHRQDYAGAVRTRPMGAGLDLFARRRDGTEFPVEISLSPISHQGSMLVAAAIRDVTDRMRAERELREARAAADCASLGKSRFLATASHDLRQPLQALLLLNGTLRRLVQDEDAREALDHQDQALGAMSRLLNALLDVSKLESGAVRPEVRDFTLAPLLEELRQEFAPIASGKGLALTIEAGEAQVHSDVTLLAQALRNLLANAIKYTSAGQVRLRLVPVPDGVRIEVGDTGCGIAPDHLPHIFDEFYQVGVAANSARDGYGLGLSIVKNIAQLLELHLDVRSRPGEGSTFSLDVPGTAAAVGNTDSTSRQRRSIGPRDGAARHLLLVEDDAGVRNATRMFLKGEGFRVSVAASYEEASRLLDEKSDFALVITDYHLESGRTGADVVAAARARYGEGFRAILVTGDTTPEIRDLPGDARLRVTSKPINAEALLGLIASLEQA